MFNAQIEVLIVSSLTLSDPYLKNFLNFFGKKDYQDCALLSRHLFSDCPSLSHLDSQTRPASSKEENQTARV